MPIGEAVAVIGRLAERKVDHFGADQRIVVAVDVQRYGQELRVIAGSSL
jgi:hypothetical protein